MAYIQFLGAAGTVTGSKHLINTGSPSGTSGFQVLIDCGLFQGPKEWRERNWRDTPVPAKEIDAVILTHAHLDHCGWIPRLVKEGFRGPIYASSPTIDLCGIILPDSGHLQEEDAAFYNKTRKSKHTPALPLYTFEEAQDAQQYFKAVKVGETVQLSSELSFRFVRAAHILGSCMAEISLKTNGITRSLLFTGDIGRVRDHKVAPGKVVHSGPAEGETADLLVMESTYGNRVHPKEDPLPELATLITNTSKRGGSVVVPAFAIERTQKFVFILKHLIESGQIPRIPVFCDSPMAIKAVEIFLKHDEEYSEETREMIRKYGSPLTWPGFIFASTPEDSKKINANSVPAVIISSSGMATRRTHSASPGAAVARSQESGPFYWLSGARHARICHQERHRANQDLRRLRPHSSPDRRAGAVQRPRRSSGVAGVAAHVPQSPGDHVFGPWRARRIAATARKNDKGIGLDSRDRQLPGKD